MHTRSRRLGLVAAAAVALLAAGCGSEEAGSEAGGSSSTQTTASGSASGEPILIGFHNDSALTGVKDAFKAGIAEVNESGGIGGRPLEVVFCDVDGTPEQSIDCANRFVEQDVVAAVQGFDNGADAAIGILKEAGIAELGQYALGPATTADIGHSFFFDTPLQAIGIAAMLAVEDEGVETIRFFSPERPDTHSLLDTVVKPAAEELGLDVDFVFFQPGSPDWTSLVTTAKSQGADAIGGMGISEDDCIAMLTAIDQVGFDGPVYAAYCTQFTSALDPSVAAGARTSSAVYPTDLADAAPPEVAEHLEIYEDAVTAAGKEELVKDVVSQGAFAAAMHVADVLGQVEGDITAASVLETMPNARGDRYFGGEYDCSGDVWPGTSACSAQVLVLEATEDGGRKIVGDGFLDLSPYVPEAK